MVFIWANMIFDMGLPSPTSYMLRSKEGDLVFKLVEKNLQLVLVKHGNCTSWHFPNNQTSHLVGWRGVGGVSIVSWGRKVSSRHPLTFWCKGTAGVLACVPGNMLFLTLGFGPYGITSPNRKGKLFCFIENLVHIYIVLTKALYE